MEDHKAEFERDHKAELDAFIAELELQTFDRLICNDGSTLQLFHWPRKNNRMRYDRMFLIRVYRDGSWSAYLDSGALADGRVNAFRKMAKA